MKPIKKVKSVKKIISLIIVAGMLLGIFAASTGYAAEPRPFPAAKPSASAPSAATLAAAAHPQIVTSAGCDAASQDLLALAQEACINMRDYCKKHVKKFDLSVLDGAQQVMVFNDAKGREGCANLFSIQDKRYPGVQMDEKIWHDLFRSHDNAYGAQRCVIHHEMAHLACNHYAHPYYAKNDRDPKIYSEVQQLERDADILAVYASNCRECATDFSKFFLHRSRRFGYGELRYIPIEKIVQKEAEAVKKEKTTHPHDLERALYLYQKAQDINSLCPYHNEEVRKKGEREELAEQREEAVMELSRSVYREQEKTKKLNLLENETIQLEAIMKQADTYGPRREDIWYSGATQRALKLGAELIQEMQATVQKLQTIQHSVASREEKRSRSAEQTSTKPTTCGKRKPEYSENSKTLIKQILTAATGIATTDQQAPSQNVSKAKEDPKKLILILAGKNK